jgi:hypothetical protein
VQATQREKLGHVDGPLPQQSAQVPMSRASENAETCRKLAHATTHQEHKKTWLQLAAHWDRLAHEAERYPGAFCNGP